MFLLYLRVWFLHAISFPRITCLTEEKMRIWKTLFLFTTNNTYKYPWGNISQKIVILPPCFYVLKQQTLYSSIEYNTIYWFMQCPLPSVLLLKDSKVFSREIVYTFIIPSINFVYNKLENQTMKNSKLWNTHHSLFLIWPQSWMIIKINEFIEAWLISRKSNNI